MCWKAQITIRFTKFLHKNKFLFCKGFQTSLAHSYLCNHMVLILSYLCSSKCVYPSVTSSYLYFHLLQSIESLCNVAHTMRRPLLFCKLKYFTENTGMISFCYYFFQCVASVFNANDSFFFIHSLDRFYKGSLPFRV